MSKIKKTFKAMKAVIRNPWLLNRVLEDEVGWRRYVADKYGINDGLDTISLPDLFGEIDDTVSPLALLDGGSMPTDLLLLRKLAATRQNASYFEIGTWRGESVANVAAVAAECYTLNLGPDEMRQRGLPEEYIRLHGFFSSGLPNVTQLYGHSAGFDFAGLGKKFDLVFIDGDHHYNAVRNDTEKVFRHLVREDSVIVWHDYGRNPEQVRFEVLAGILDGCPGEKRSQLYFVENTLCAIHTTRKLNARKFVAPMRPERYFEFNIKMKGLRP